MDQVDIGSVVKDVREAIADADSAERQDRERERRAAYMRMYRARHRGGANQPPSRKEQLDAE